MMTYGRLIPTLFLLLVFKVINDASGEKNTILMRYKGTAIDAKLFGKSIGLKFHKSIFDDDEEFYTFKDTNITPRKQSDFDKLVQKSVDKKLKSLEIEKREKVFPRTVYINDAYWWRQWHYRSLQSPSMNVFKTWNKGYTGSGITIAIVDDGVEFSHSDLAANYVSSYSYDFVVDVYNGDHKVRSEYHGTSCAGVAAAVKNTDCVIGAAYDASIASLRVYGDRGYTTASEKAMALTYKLQNIDIYSNSWGPSDSGIYFFDMADVLVKAFEKGVTKGRGGLGAIYTWASGNGGSKHDDCNADGYAKSIYTIAVAAMSETTSYTRYSEKCSAILTAAYSGDYPNRRITTTSANGTCVNTFSGTSSACPVASGIIAQTLQANSFLTWRDIQHIIVETSVSSGLHSNIIVSTNGAGKKFSQYFGFGLLDAEGMVDRAATWSNVPSYITCEYPKRTVYRSTYRTTIKERYDADNCYIKYLEWVEVTIKYGGYYRGDIQIDLQSPLSTTSTIFSRRNLDRHHSSSKVETTFMSVHFWGEDPKGVWTLSLSDRSLYSGTSMKLDFWQLTFHGTVTNPLSGTPVAGSLGGACSTSDDCRSVTNGGCLLDVKICVECNKNNNSVNSFCAKDGETGGYCNSFIPCLSLNGECINNVCRPKVPKDGETGGYCNSFIPCLSLNGECINNVCRPKVPKDGETGGYCNSFIPCLSLNGECINNVCRPKVPKDGETGGYCNSFIPCLSLNGECINNVCRPNVPKDESSSDNTGVIAGAVVGSVVGVILIACGIYCMYKKSAPPRRVSPVSDGLQQERQQQQRLQQQQQQYTHSSDSSQPSFSHGGAHPIHQL